MKKRAFCIVLVYLLAFNCTVSASASSVEEKTIAAYKQYMDKNFDMDNSYSYYNMIDIDGNGIPELLFHEFFNVLCTYDKKNDKVIVLEKVDYGRSSGEGGFQYNTKKKQVYLESGTTKTLDSKIVKVNGKKATTVRTFVQDAVTDAAANWFYTYYVDGKKVSSKGFGKKVKKALKGFINVKP